MGKMNKLFLGILIGTAIGVAFAPRKGSDLRKQLAKDMKEGGSPEGTLKSAAVSMGKDIAETAKEVYHDPKVQKQLEKGKKEAKKFIEAAKKNLEENGEEWVEMAREKLLQAKKKVEKEMHLPKK